jgi:hypothetical protein
MKIGLSYSRCVLDIVEERVDIQDVLVVVARTDFDPGNDEQWRGIWEGYTMGGLSNPEWASWAHVEGAEEKFRDVTLQLWHGGKFHQPRQFGAYPARRREFWLETCLPNDELERNPMAKQAWDKFQTVAGLTGVKLDKEYQ